MPIEIEILDNQYGIKKVFLSVEEKIVELTVKTDSDPTGINLAKSLLSQRITAVDEGNYESNSFSVKLPKSNCIRMKGNLENIVDFLKNNQAVSAEIVQELEKQIKPILFQRQQPRSDFFDVKSKTSPSLSSNEPDVEGEVRELIDSFEPEDRPKVLTLLKLSEKLDPERRRALQESLSAQVTTPSRGSNTPTRS